MASSEEKSMQGAGENCRYLFPEASPLGSDGLTSFLQPQSYGPWPACPIMGPESVYSPITGSAGDLHPAPSPALSPIMGLVSRTQVDKRQQRDLLALMGLVSHTQGDERQQKAPEPLLSQSLSENKAREWANEGDAPKAAFTPVTSWLIGPEHPWVPIQKSKEESESCTFTRTKDLIASFHSIATQEPGYSFVPGTRLDDGLVEGVAPKEATEVTGLPHLVNYVVSRVGSDLGQLSAAKSEPGVNQASLERWLDSALLEEVSTVKSEQPDSTNQKRDERARSADTGAKSNLLDRLEVGMCRICRQQVDAVNLMEHSRLCIAADQCDAKYLSLNKRLRRLADGMECMLPDGSSSGLEEDSLDADAEAVAVLERLISIAHRGEAITSQQEDSDQQCSICIQDLHILQEGVAQIVDEMIDVSARVVLETFGRRVERLLREKQRALQKCKQLFQPDSDVGRTRDADKVDTRRIQGSPSSRAGSKPPRGLPKLNLPGTTTSLPRPLDSRRSQSPGAYQISPGSSPDTSRGQSRSFLSPTRSSPRSPTLSDSSGGNPPSPQGSPPSAFFPPSLISRRSPSPAMSTRSSEDGDGLHPGKEEPSRAHAQQNQEEVHGQQPYGPFGDVRRSLSSPEPVPMGPLDTPGSVLDHQNFELEPGSHSPPEFRFTGSPYSHSKVGQTSTADRALNTTGSLPELSGMLESGSKQPGDGSQPVKKQATSSPGTGAIGVRNPNQHVLTRPAHLRKVDSSSSSEKYDVFISHAGEDKSFASHLHDTFERLKLRPFLDETNLHPGECADLKIFGAVEGAPVGLVLLGETFFAKKWPMDELKEIVAQRTLLPVLYKLEYEQAERLLAQNTEAAKMEPAAWSAFLNQVLRTTMCTNPSTRKSETPFLHHIAFCVVRRLVKYSCPEIAKGWNQLSADRVLKKTKKACTIMATEFVELSVKQANEVKAWAQELQTLRDNLE